MYWTVYVDEMGWLYLEIRVLLRRCSYECILLARESVLQREFFGKNRSLVVGRSAWKRFRKNQIFGRFSETSQSTIDFLLE